MLAEQTGGVAIAGQNDLDAALRRIDAEAGNYYVLRYSPSPAAPNDSTRLVEVRSTRAGAIVTSPRPSR